MIDTRQRFRLIIYETSAAKPNTQTSPKAMRKRDVRLCNQVRDLVTSGEWRDVCRGRGGSKDIMQEKNEEEYVVIEVRPEGCIYGQGSYITLDRWDMRSKFGHTTLCEIRLQ